MSTDIAVIAEWLGQDEASARAFCAELQCIVVEREVLWAEIASCVSQYPQMSRSPQLVAAVLRGTLSRETAKRPVPSLSARLDPELEPSWQPRGTRHSYRSYGRPRRRYDPDLDAPPSTFSGHDPRKYNEGLSRCPHGVSRARKCHICHPDEFDMD